MKSGYFRLLALPEQSVHGNLIFADMFCLFYLFQIFIRVLKIVNQEGPQVLHFKKSIGVTGHNLSVFFQKGVVKGAQGGKVGGFRLTVL